MAVKEHGNGVTITFSGGFTAVMYTFDGSETTLPDVEVSTLTTSTVAEFDPGDLEDPGEFTCDIVAATTAAAPTVGTVETVTITYAIPSGASSGATYAGTGYIKGVKFPSAVNNERLMYSLTVKWDGKTGPTFTVAS